MEATDSARIDCDAGDGLRCCQPCPGTATGDSRSDDAAAGRRCCEDGSAALPVSGKPRRQLRRLQTQTRHRPRTNEGRRVRGRILASMTTRAHYRLPGQRCWFTLLLQCCANHYVQAQQPLTWDQVKARFEAANPALKADSLGVDELKAQEITAYLRPNPQFNFALDGTQFPPHTGPYRPLVSAQEQTSLGYLHERQHKRELRLESAKEGTQIGQSEHADLERTLLFNLRSAFVQTLQAKAVLDLAKANLEYYDKIINISRDR